MTAVSDVFEKHYQQYRAQLAELDFNAAKDTLGLDIQNSKILLTLFNKRYEISKTGIFDESTHRADYVAAVILAKYLLLSPDYPYENLEWVAFKDFKKRSHFTNVNYFSSDTERAIEKHFTGKLEDLISAGKKLGGTFHNMEISYDLAMQFTALPRISLLLLFNDGDDEFPAKCTVLFQKHAEFYLDPESLAIIGARLAKSLINLDLES